MNWLHKAGLVFLSLFIGLSASNLSAQEKADEQEQQHGADTWEPRHQWFDFNIGFGLYGHYWNAKAIKLRFEKVYWQIFRVTQVGQPSETWGGAQLLAGTEVGIPVRLSPKTELLVGLGVDVGFSAECYQQCDCSGDWSFFGAIGEMVESAPGLYLAPSATFSRHIAKHFALNVGLEASIFTGLYLDDHQMQAPYPIPNISLFVGFTI